MPKKHAQSNKTRKRSGRDIDEIHADLIRPDKMKRFQKQPFDEDLPGGGQHYCVACDRHFVDEQTKTGHEKTKAHKRRLRALREQPHTQREAELAGGLGVDDRIKLDGLTDLTVQSPVR